MPLHLDCGPCVIRSWRPGDEDSLVWHANDRDVWLNLRDRFPHPYTLADAEGWVRFASGQTPETAFAIDAGGEAVGGIGLELREDVERCSAEIGYWLGRAFWGQGLATAAVRGLTAWAFRTHGLTRVYSLPFADNGGSCRVLEKTGYRCEGRLRRAAVKAGVVRDQQLYAITDEDLQLSDLASLDRAVASDQPIARDVFDRLAEGYAARVGTKAHNALYDRPAVLSLLPPVEGLRVLDAGCGPGVYAEWLADHGADVVGLDVSPRMVDLARERLRGRASFIVADLGKPLDFLTSGSFDLVVSALALDYVRDWEATFAELFRVLREPGHVIFSVGHPADEFFDHHPQGN